jgi:hypothetical protein
MRKNLTSAALFVALAVLCVVGAARPDDARDKLVGDWSGESICVGDRPACHDEKVVYHVSKTAGKSDTVTIAADKIVDGKPDAMGELECKYDAEKRTLTCEFTRGRTHGVFELEVKGNVIEGHLFILPERTVGRRIKVSKDK